MTNPDTLELEVKDFGPITKSTIDLRPLTVFVGPSNTGKSWLAILLYALHRFFGHPSSAYYRGVPRTWRMMTESLSPEQRKAVLAAFTPDAIRALKESSTRRKRPLRVPASFAQGMTKVLEAQAPSITRELVAAFGVDRPRALVRREKRTHARLVLRRSLLGPRHPLEHELVLRPGTTSIRTSLPGEPSFTVEAHRRLRDQIAEFAALDSESDNNQWNRIHFFSRLMDAAMPQLVGPLHRPAYYMPADRTGVMHAHSTVVSARIASAPLTGIRRVSTAPLLSGVLADFLQQLIELDQPRRRRPSRTRALADALETNMLRGKIRVEPGSVTGYPHFTYLPNRWTEPLPLLNASSMVSELAPVVLYSRYIVEPGGVLIVEEPESHLHPSMQILFTRSLAAAVRAGLRVVITTHSDWVLEELANVVQRSSIPKEASDMLEADVALRPDQVGVWLFQRKDLPRGSVVEEVPLDEEAGLYPTRYSRLREALYNESTRIYNYQQRKK